MVVIVCCIVKNRYVELNSTNYNSETSASVLDQHHQVCYLTTSFIVTSISSSKTALHNILQDSPSIAAMLTLFTCGVDAIGISINVNGPSKVPSRSIMRFMMFFLRYINYNNFVNKPKLGDFTSPVKSRIFRSTTGFGSDRSGLLSFTPYVKSRKILPDASGHQMNSSTDQIFMRPAFVSRSFELDQYPNQHNRVCITPKDGWVSERVLGPYLVMKLKSNMFLNAIKRLFPARASVRASTDRLIERAS